MKKELTEEQRKKRREYYKKYMKIYMKGKMISFSINGQRYSLYVGNQKISQEDINEFIDKMKNDVYNKVIKNPKKYLNEIKS